MKRITGLISFGASALSLIFACVLFFMDTGNYESPLYYGGDAYTGIQQAAAQTANNTMALARICRTGFGAVCLIASFAFLITALMLLTSHLQQNNEPEDSEPAEPSVTPGMYTSAPFDPDMTKRPEPPQNVTPPEYNPPAYNPNAPAYNPNGYAPHSYNQPASAPPAERKTPDTYDPFYFDKT